jgi:GNAT superfamily N-acetyltransferase
MTNNTIRPEFRIRPATPGDAGAIAGITVRGWQAAYRGILPKAFLDGLNADARETGWRSMIESDVDGGTPAWVAEAGGRTIGFVSSGPPRDEDVPLPGAEVYAIYVEPEQWRHGTGAALLTVAADYWLTAGATTLVLWVFEANARARSFYAAMGWHRDGARQTLELGGVAAWEIRYRWVAAAAKG